MAAVLAYYPAARAGRAVLLEAAQLSSRVAALEAATIHRALSELWLYARGESLPSVATRYLSAGKAALWCRKKGFASGLSVAEMKIRSSAGDDCDLQLIATAHRR